MSPSNGLTIAQVSPYSWEGHHEVNAYVAGAGAELKARGHRVVVAAPGGTREETRLTQRTIERTRSDGAAVFGAGWEGRRIGDDGPAVLRVGAALKLPAGARPRPAPVPVDISRSLEGLLSAIDFDVVHVHEPFAPSAASAALRHSRALNAATFHLPTERVLSTQVARPLVEIFFGRLDARMVSGRSTGELVERFFPGSYEIVRPAAEVGSAERVPGGPVRIVYCQREERGALRIFLRALRKLPLDLDWEADIWIGDAAIQTPRMNRRLRERVRILRPAQIDAEDVVAGAAIAVAASGGPQPAPSLLYAAFAAGAVPVAAQIDAYEELVDDEDGE